MIRFTCFHKFFIASGNTSEVQKGHVFHVEAKTFVGVRGARRNM